MEIPVGRLALGEIIGKRFQLGNAQRKRFEVLRCSVRGRQRRDLALDQFARIEKLEWPRPGVGTRPMHRRIL
jgi:hypothetical protein